MDKMKGYVAFDHVATAIAQIEIWSDYEEFRKEFSMRLQDYSCEEYREIKALLIDGNSNVWQFNGTAWQNFGLWREGGFSYGLDVDTNGNVWVSGNGGAAKRDVQTGNWQRYRITNSSQIAYWVEDISLDNDGNIWMTGNAGPGVGGFQKFDGVRWTGFNNENYGLGYPFPFPTDNTEVIYHRPSNGNIIVNPMFNYLHAWNGNTYTSLNYPLDRSEGVVEDSQNRSDLRPSQPVPVRRQRHARDLGEELDADDHGPGPSPGRPPDDPGGVRKAGWPCRRSGRGRTAGFWRCGEKGSVRRVKRSNPAT